MSGKDRGDGLVVRSDMLYARLREEAYSVYALELLCARTVWQSSSRRQLGPRVLKLAIFLYKK